MPHPIYDLIDLFKTNFLRKWLIKRKLYFIIPESRRDGELAWQQLCSAIFISRFSLQYLH